MRELLNAYPAQSQGDKRGCSDSIAWREKGVVALRSYGSSRLEKRHPSSGRFRRQTSRTTSFGSLSSRRLKKVVWRICSSSVHSANATSQTSFGLTHWIFSGIFGGFSNGRLALNRGFPAPRPLIPWLVWNYPAANPLYLDEGQRLRPTRSNRRGTQTNHHEPPEENSPDYALD